MPFSIFALVVASSGIAFLGASFCNSVAYASPAPQKSSQELSDAESATAKADDSDVLSLSHSGEGWRLKLEVKPRSPRLSDVVHMSLSVEASSQLVFQEPIYLEFPETFKLQKTKNSGLHGTPSLSNETGGYTQLRQFEYELSPQSTGELPLPRIVLPYSVQGSNGEDIGFITPPESKIHVQSDIELDSVDLNKIATAPTPLPMSPRLDYSFWLIASLCGFIAVAALILLWKWFPRNRHGRILSSELRAEGELRSLEKEKLPEQGKSKEYVSRLSDVVRRYIETKSGTSAPELTTPEFIHLIRDDARLASDTKETLKEFLETADLVKFAGKNATTDVVDRSLNSAKQIIRAEHWVHFQHELRPSSARNLEGRETR